MTSRVACRSSLFERFFGYLDASCRGGSFFKEERVNTKPHFKKEYSYSSSVLAWWRGFMAARFTKVFEKNEDQQLHVHVQRRRVKQEQFTHNKQPAIRQSHL